jgi:hypothetical protein
VTSLDASIAADSTVDRERIGRFPGGGRKLAILASRAIADGVLSKSAVERRV